VGKPNLEMAPSLQAEMLSLASPEKKNLTWDFFQRGAFLEKIEKNSMTS